MKTKQLLEAIKAGHLQVIEVLGESTDDHILCANVKLTIVDPNSGLEHPLKGVEVEHEVMCCGWEGLAAFTYFSDSARARKDAIEILIGDLECTLEDEEEDAADDEDEIDDVL